MEETFTHKASGKQYTRRADGTCWYGDLRISVVEYERAKRQNDALGGMKES